MRRHFVKNPAKGKISDEKKKLTDRLLSEKISLAGIARVAMISEIWLQKYVNEKYKKTTKQTTVIPKKNSSDSAGR